MNLCKGLCFDLEVSSLVGRHGSSVLRLTEAWPVPPHVLSQGPPLPAPDCQQGRPSLSVLVDLCACSPLSWPWNPCLYSRILEGSLLCTSGKTLFFLYLIATFIYFFFFSFISTSWRLISLQHCSGFCHTFTWISHGFTCIPHPDPPSHLPLHPIPPGLPSVPGPSSCLMLPAWAGDLFHPW